MNFRGKLNCLSKSDGSVELYTNDTGVCVGINGPVEVRLNRELSDKAYVNVLLRPNVGIPSIREKSLEYHLREILDGIICTNQNPRTSINITIQEIQNNGSMFSCILNACCLALLDANIPLKSMFCSVACALDSNDKSKIILFPTFKQEKTLSFIIINFVFESLNNTLISCDTNGIFDKDDYELLFEQAHNYSSNIFDYFRNLVKNKYT